jgi:hypothetical protein
MCYVQQSEKYIICLNHNMIVSEWLWVNDCKPMIMILNFDRNIPRKQDWNFKTEKQNYFIRFCCMICLFKTNIWIEIAKTKYLLIWSSLNDLGVKQQQCENVRKWECDEMRVWQNDNENGTEIWWSNWIGNRIFT